MCRCDVCPKISSALLAVMYRKTKVEAQEKVDDDVRKRESERKRGQKKGRRVSILED